MSYSYAETAELLTAARALVVPFDPLRDDHLPEGVDAVVIGGALPESYAEELSANRRLCAEVAEHAQAGRPVIAEGAGLLWLAREFDGRPMCGVIDAVGVTTDQVVVGYREATARSATPVAALGARVVGYKQHRAVVTPRAGQNPAWTWGGSTPEGFVWRRTHASQLQLHWAGNPEIACSLVTASVPPVAQPAPAQTAPAQPVPAQPTAPTSDTPDQVEPAEPVLIDLGVQPVGPGGEDRQ
jgi:cobyrinic acid a,c-diamide synthase